MSGGHYDEDIITGHKKHVKRLNNKKDWGAELEHYRKNYTAVGLQIMTHHSLVMSHL